MNTELDFRINVALEILSHFARGATDDPWRGSTFCVLAEDECGTRIFTLEVRALLVATGKGVASAQN